MTEVRHEVVVVPANGSFWRDTRPWGLVVVVRQASAVSRLVSVQYPRVCVQVRSLIDGRTDVLVWDGRMTTFRIDDFERVFVRWSGPKTASLAS